MTVATPTLGFILDCFTGTRDGHAVVYAIGRLSTGETFGIVDDRRKPTLYVRASDFRRVPEAVPTQLATMDGEAVFALRTADVRGRRRAADALHRDGIRTYEGDIDFAHAYLMENGLRGSVQIEGAWRASDHVARIYVNPEVSPADWVPKLRVLAFDIETDMETEEVLAVSLVVYGHGEEGEEVLVLGAPRPEDPPWMATCATERELLDRFVARLKALDPDVLTGWNIADFDLPVLSRRMARYGKDLDLGRTRPGVGRVGGKYPPHQGRQMLDALRLVRSSGKRFEDLRLQTVANEVLGRSKVLAADEIMTTYHADRAKFALYCLEDSRLVRDLLRKEKLIELTVERSRLIGLPLAKTWGSVASFEFMYMTELRRRGRVAPSYGVDATAVGNVPGGLVLDPEPGLHPRILVFDFRSLYPSIMRTFNIDPLAHALAAAGKEAQPIVAPNGAAFARERSVLPEVLDRFTASRAAALKEGDDVAAYAYKIIMNSFYGVLGTDNCRFATPALAGSITSFGQALLQWTRSHFEACGAKVLYGDTDSLFVEASLPEAVTSTEAVRRGKALAVGANEALARHVRETYKVESRLDLKFEKYYRWLLLPQSRGGLGRPKSYAGLRQDERGEKVEIIGMEAVRSDWTPLARGLQRDLLAMLFAGEPAAALEQKVRNVIKAVNAGTRDEDLVYRKQMRRPVESYTTTTPPHVRAARMLPKVPRVVRYVMTAAGAQPVGLVTAAVDHAHYVEKQIVPIVGIFAGLSGFDPEKACRTNGQRGLFDALL